MPFTPAHAVAALPFRLTRLDTTALVIGCLSPDFEYFLRLSARGFFGHTLAGVLLLDLPLSLLVLWLYERYVKHAIGTLLPRLFPFHRAGSQGESREPRVAWTMAVASILLGAASHIVWDAFTHPTFWPYRHLPLLRAPVSLPVLGTAELYKYLQYGSGVAGMGILMFLWAGWIRRAGDPYTPGARRTAVVLAVVAAAGAVLRVVLGAELSGGSSSRTVYISEAVITFLALLWLELVVYGVSLQQSGSG